MEIRQNSSSLIFIRANSLNENNSLELKNCPSWSFNQFITKSKFLKSFDLSQLSVFRSEEKPRIFEIDKKTNNVFLSKKNQEVREEYRDIVTLRVLTPYEEVEEYKDNFPFLALRTAIIRIKVASSEICSLIITSSAFEIFIVLVILMNVITLSLNGASENVQGSISEIELFYLITYTTEAALKIIAKGFLLSKNAYMKDFWNYIDLVIIISGWIDRYGQSSFNLTALRTLRILRPLRGITSIKGLKVIVLALISSLKELMASISLLVIFLLIFAVAGLQIWSGMLKHQCIKINTGIITGNVCGNYACGYEEECGSALDNPNFGATNFDNVLYSFLTVFQCITLEGWTQTMEYVMDAYNVSAAIYFILLVFIGAYLLISLTLVVIKSALTSSIRSVNKNKANKERVEIVETEELARQLTKVVVDSGMIKQEEDEFEKDFGISSNIPDIDSGNNRSFGLQRLRRSCTIHIEHDLIPANNNFYSPTIETGEHSGPIGSNLRTNGIRSRKFTNGKSEDKVNRFESLKSMTPLLSRMNSSIRVSKNLMSTIQHKINLVPMILSSSLSTLSSYDTKPEIIQEKFSQCQSYSFTYGKKDSQDVLSFILNNYHTKQEEFKNGFLEAPEDFAKFKKACKISSYKSVFFSMKIPVSEVINSIQLNDAFFNQVSGRFSKIGTELKATISLESLNSFNYRLWSHGCLGYWEKIQYPISSFIKSKTFNYFIYISIITNTVVLAIDHYGISSSLQNTLAIFNIVFTFIFAFEIFVKILGVGLKMFLRDIMNYLDLAIVINSLIEFVFLSGGKSALTAFRAIRVFKLIRAVRVARLLRYLQSMNHIIIVISRSIYKFAYVATLLLLFIVVYSLLGMQIYAGNLKFVRQSRSSFENFYWAFISIFQVLTIENWQNLLYDTMNSSAGPGSAMFLVSWVFLGNFILLNLFLAILLDGFTYEEDEELVIKPEQSSLNIIASRSVPTLIRRRSSLFADLEQKTQKKREEVKMQMDIVSDDSGSQVSIPEYLKEFHRFDKFPCELSFYLFSKKSKLRIFCNKIATSEKFESVIIVIISLSSIKLIVETYTLNNQDVTNIFYYIDIVFTLCFITEFLIKAINSGFWIEKSTYLKDSWNVIDFLIIIISLVDWLVASISLKYIKIIRLLRTLRALRFISHNISMKIVIVSLLQSLVAILNVVLVCLIIWVMFAILGVSLFGGKLYTCSNPNILDMDTCESSNYSWSQQFPNYDTVIDAMIALFVVSSEEGWPDLMYSAIDAKNTGVAPEKNYNPSAGLYFIFFIFIGNFFFMNLFIGVVFEQFNEVTKQEGSFAALILTKEQMLWVEIQQLIVKSKPYIEFMLPTNKFQLFFYNLTRHRYFEVFIMVSVLINMLQMCIVYDGASSTYTTVLEDINLVFTSIFIIEACLKLIGNGLHYFKSNWNKFDFLVVTSSIIDILLAYFAANSIKLLRAGPQLIRIVKLFRISRLFRLFRSLRPLQTLLTILKYSLPAIFNVLSLLLLFFFIYSVMGVYLFNDITTGVVIDKYTNFSNFGVAMYSLFRSATGENWYLLMNDCSKNIGRIGSYIYFCSFIIITSFIMFNLFIMVILQNYDDYQSNPQSVLKIFNKDIKKFKSCWSVYSTNNGQRVDHKKLPDLLYELGEDFGVSDLLERDKMFKLLTAMEIPLDHEGFVHYNEFLFGILKRKYSRNIFMKNDKHGKKIVNKQNAETVIKLEKIRNKFFKGAEVGAKKGNFGVFVGMIYVKTVFKAWKRYSAGRKYKKMSVSITPRMTEEEFPGIISERSSFICFSSRSLESSSSESSVLST